MFSRRCPQITPSTETGNNYTRNLADQNIMMVFTKPLTSEKNQKKSIKIFAYLDLKSHQKNLTRPHDVKNVKSQPRSLSLWVFTINIFRHQYFLSSHHNIRGHNKYFLSNDEIMWCVEFSLLTQNVFTCPSSLAPSLLSPHLKYAN